MSLLRTSLLGLSLLTVLFRLPSESEAQTVYVVDNGNSTVHSFATTGADEGSFISSGLANATDIVVNQAGNFYVSNEENANNVSEYSPNGTFLKTLDVGAGQTYGLAVNASGDLLVASPYANTIQEFSPADVPLGSFAATGLNIPTYLALDAVGNVYVDNQGDGTIQEFSSTGGYLGVFATTTGDYVQQMAFDRSGDLLVANSATGNVAEFSPTGKSMGNFVSGLKGPEGLAFLPNGNLLVSTDANVIAEFSPTGASLGNFATTGLNGPAGLLVVPEPGTCLLLALGGLGLLSASLRRRCAAHLS